MRPEPYRVVDRVVETDDVVTIALAPLGPPLTTPAPGQFVMVWAFGVGEIPISVSAARADGSLSLTVRNVGAVSAAVVGSEPGAVLGLRGPFGTAWPVAEAAGRDAIVVAGGLGLAPLRLAIDALATPGPHAPSRLTIVVGSREPAQLLYPGDLARWAAAGAHVHTTVDAADRSWHGAVGTATALIERLAEPHDLAFVCGPEIMMTTGARALIATGTPAAGVHVSLERNMHCGIGHCGRCQLGPHLLCRDGAVVGWPAVAALLEVRGR
jgi:NAD(P)H-flavin reductase